MKIATKTCSVHTVLCKYKTNISPTDPYNLEILERCNVCVRTKRTIGYCQQKKCHKVPKAAPCVECYHARVPTATCRMELKHLGCSVTITETKINTGEEEEKKPSLKKFYSLSKQPHGTPPTQSCRSTFSQNGSVANK